MAANSGQTQSQMQSGNTSTNHSSKPLSPSATEQSSTSPSAAIPSLSPNSLLMLYKIPINKQNMKLVSTDLGMSFGKDAAIQFTREWFARVLVDEPLFESFSQFIEVCVPFMDLYIGLVPACVNASSIMDCQDGDIEFLTFHVSLLDR
jgi:hypothetical protein